MALAGLIMGYISIATSILFFFGLISAIAIPSFMMARTSSQMNACINNLRQIEAAKDQYGLEKDLTNGANCTFDGAVDDVAVFSNLVGGANGYIKHWPLCPSSTTDASNVSSMAALSAYDYIPNCMGSNACCRHHGNDVKFPHVLPGPE